MILVMPKDYSNDLISIHIFGIYADIGNIPRHINGGKYSAKSLAALKKLLRRIKRKKR